MVRKILLGKYRGLRFGFIFAISFIFFISSSSSESNRLFPLVEPFVDSPGKAIGSDFNGDGIHDVIMGAELNNDNGADAGAAYLLYGTTSFSSTYRLDGDGINVTLLGKAAGDTFGRSVGSAGDINADGFDDIIVGAPKNADGATNGGATYILYGHPSLPATITAAAATDVTIVGGFSTSDYLGREVASAGDINGDGFDDVSIGADGIDTPGTNAGARYILYGSAALSSDYDTAGTGVNVTLLGKAASDEMGLGTCSGTGDVNRDSLDDVIVCGRRNNDGGSNDEGAAYILFGSTSLSATIRMDGAGANLTILGDTAGGLLGIGASGGGDINGDGFDDFLIASALQGADVTGASYLFYGRTFSNTTFDVENSQEDVKISGKANNDQLSIEVNPGGDINDDGFFDIVSCARFNDDGGGNNAGACYITYGGSSLATSLNAGNADVTILGKTADDQLGQRFSGVGDINNDGLPDLAMGAINNDDGPGANNAGAVYILLGNDSLSSSFSLAGNGVDVTILGKGSTDTLGFVRGGRGNAGP